MNTSSNKPHRYKVCMNEQGTDKSEVGSSSLPRPTSFLKLDKGFGVMHYRKHLLLLFFGYQNLKN